ncbi:hypothetical protein [Ferrovum myxofaciens]|uniref:hypothetical protein n=1 Tax=Ferrovum myxofaciens TaxID=416213 RepID=UPI0004E222B5|nr:hypothetical protein [Ferrovum myxofaciens]
MKKTIEQLAGVLREKRFSINQALFLFAIPVALISYFQFKKNESFITENILLLPKKLKSPIHIRSNSGSNNVASLDEYNRLVLSIPLPTRNDRFRECFGIARGMLIVAWLEISSEQVVTAGVEMANFSAFAALDAALEEHRNYKNIVGFKKRLEKITERNDSNIIENLASASGYTKDELKSSVLASLAATRNVTAHCKEQSPEKSSRVRSAEIDFRPLHLVSAILTELDRA